MLQISFTLDPRAIGLAAKARTKAEALTDIAARAASVYGCDAHDVVSVLSAREHLGSTGFGQGIAIPHGRLDNLSHPVVILLRPQKPLAWDAVDELPVDCIAALLSPATGGAIHLKALAELSRMLRDKAFLDKLRGAGDADSLYALIEAYDQRNAA